MTTTNLDTLNLENLDFSTGAGIIASILMIILMLATAVIIPLMVFLLYYAIIAAVCAAFNYPFFHMANKAGIKKAWITFLPPLHFYTMLMLSKREFNLFNKYKTNNRKKVFKQFIIVTLIFLASTLVSLFLSMVASILGGIFPVVGMLILMLVMLFEMVVLPLCALAYTAYVCILYWRTNYDLLLTYGVDEEQAKLFSILGSFIPLVMTIYGYMLMNKEPDYTV